MRQGISTNIILPEDIFRAVKIKAAKERKSMKQLVIEALSILLRQEHKNQSQQSATNMLLKFSGTIKTGRRDGSLFHDEIIYD